MSTGDGALELGAPAQRGLLAVLLTSPNIPVTVDRLVDELWGDAPPLSAHHLVQVYVSRLRGLLGELPDGPRIVHDGAGYVLRIAPGELDSDRFGAGVERGRKLLAREPEAADEAFAAALRLWRGEPFGDLSPLPPAVRARADDLERRHLAAFEDWAGVRLDRGLHRELIAGPRGSRCRAPVRRGGPRPADPGALPLRPAGGGAGDRAHPAAPAARGPRAGSLHRGPRPLSRHPAAGPAPRARAAAAPDQPAATADVVRRARRRAAGGRAAP